MGKHAHKKAPLFGRGKAKGQADGQPMRTHGGADARAVSGVQPLGSLNRPDVTNPANTFAQEEIDPFRTFERSELPDWAVQDYDQSLVDSFFNSPLDRGESENSFNIPRGQSGVLYSMPKHHKPANSMTASGRLELPAIPDSPPAKQQVGTAIPQVAARPTDIPDVASVVQPATVPAITPAVQPTVVPVGVSMDQPAPASTVAVPAQFEIDLSSDREFTTMSTPETNPVPQAPTSPAPSAAPSVPSANASMASTPAVDSAGVNPMGSAVADQSVADQVVTGPATTESAAADQVAAGPAVTGPTPADSTIADSAATETAATDPTPADPAPTDPTATESAAADPAAAGPATTDSAVTESAAAGPTAADTQQETKPAFDAPRREDFARFRCIYESRDGQLALYEDEEGHLTAVNTNRFV